MRTLVIALAVALAALVQRSKADELVFTAKPVNYSRALQLKPKPSILVQWKNYTPDWRRLVGEGACGGQGCGPCERPFYDDLGRFDCFPCKSCGDQKNKCSGNC